MSEDAGAEEIGTVGGLPAFVVFLEIWKKFSYAISTFPTPIHWRFTDRALAIVLGRKCFGR